MKESAPDEAAAPVRSRSKTASRAFWGTIALFAVITIGAAIVGLERTPSVDPTPTQLERMLSEGGAMALQRVEPDLEAQLDTIYAPVYAAIPDYVNFHYSIKGQYTELALLVAGRIEDSIHSRLFGGYEERLKKAEVVLDSRFAAEYETALDEHVQKVLAGERPGTVLGEATQIALDDATERARVTAPVAGAAALVGSGGAKALTAGIAKSLAAKVFAKAGAKTAAKGLAALKGAGAGVALCSWSGPFAAACGVGGGFAAWFLADGAIVNLDELVHGDEFEAELRSLIDGHRVEVKQRLNQALERKYMEMDREKEKIMAGFRLRDL